MSIITEDGETIIKEGSANHFKGLESVGGKLYLTNLRLVFKSHAINIQGHEESYRLDDIISVLPRNTLGIVPNGMTLILKDGREEKFVVNERQDWMNRIKSMKARGVPQ
ncbi:MAG: hypothetical protein NTW99_02575 [Chloroflexi bacterium]|nr:hypothetical protein [Chloroflexota bacterium]